MPVFWDQEDLQPLRNTPMAEKLSGKWPMTGCHVEHPTQVLRQQGTPEACVVHEQYCCSPGATEGRTGFLGVLKHQHTLLYASGNLLIEAQ